MESATRILHCINLIWITDIAEQQYIMTARIVIHSYIHIHSIDPSCCHLTKGCGTCQKHTKACKTYKIITV
jgi:hypothetical protein